jgi:arsenate reductase
MITIYHNPACSKSRQALQLLRDAGDEPAVVEYLKTPLDAAAIRDLLGKLGVAPATLIRRKEARDLGVDLGGSDEALVAAMAAHPILIERPVVVKGGKAVVARPPELATTL